MRETPPHHNFVILPPSGHKAGTIFHGINNGRSGFSVAQAGETFMKIRAIQPNDRNIIESILKAVGNFTEPEIIVAIELVEEAIATGNTGDYIAYVLEDDNGVCGYACYGLTPMTKSTYDFYWLAVDPAKQGKGYGKTLIRYVENEVKNLGGSLLVLETSSQESYRKTTACYESSGYVLSARIKDFYKPGDDKLIYLKYL
jgi:ribosomal protein S18 acetylase RimI-like enzyme